MLANPARFDYDKDVAAFIRRFILVLLRRPLISISVTGAITLLALSVLPKIQIDHSVDVFFDRDSPSYVQFQEWKKEFGSNQLIVVALDSGEVFTEKSLRVIRTLTLAFERLPHVDEVTSITNVNDIRGSDQDFIVEKFIKEIPSDPDALSRLETAALQNPLYVKNLISPDGMVAGISIELVRHEGEDDTYKKEVIEDVFEILQKEVPSSHEYYVSGLTTIEHFYARYMQEDLKRFLPLIFVFLIAVLVISFRRLGGVLIPLVTITVSLVWTMAFLYFCGFSINNVTTIIPPIILAIAVADSVHLVGETLQRARRGDFCGGKEESSAVAETAMHLLKPCALTTLTTMIGFYSLTVSRIPPVRELGIVAGTGVFFAFVLTFTFLPALIKQFHLCAMKPGGGRGALDSGFDAFLKKMAGFSERFHRAILWGAVLLVAGCVWGTTFIQSETSVLEYFKPQTQVYQATTFMEENLSGVHFLQISLRAQERDYFKDPARLREIENLERFLEKVPEVDKVESVVDYVKEINKSFHNENPGYYAIPESRPLLAQYLLLYGARDLREFVDSQWEWTTVQVRLTEHSTARLSEVIENVEGYLHRHFSGIEARVLGQTVLEVETNNAVTEGQVKSLAMAMAVIFVMMFFVFRTFGAGMVSMGANLLPLLINFGIMGFAGIRLDSATSMISAIAIGIIVDDTIHYMHSFQHSLQSRGKYREAMYDAFHQKGRPIILTSLILFCGFGVMIFSHFVPTYYFGMLSALLMIHALVVDLIILPSALIALKPRFRSGRKGKENRENELVR
ncbi:MAG: MMPL family transporter [Candidatus Omnitrophica bacterium]|nr:MMPL family transporter [Candidatus Omnitrophota bacterium]